MFTITGRGFFVFVPLLFYICGVVHTLVLVPVSVFCYFVGSCFNFFSFPFTSMSASGEGNNELVTAREVDPSEV